MILFGAEAFLATSTSKFGIEIPRIDDENLSSSPESTISTSLIHCIASVGNCEQVHTSVLNLIFQQEKVAGVGYLSKWKIRNLQSLLVFHIILWRVSSTYDDWIFGWRSRLASQISILFWFFTFLRCRRVKRLFNWRTPLIQFLRIKSWWRCMWICKSVSRHTTRVPYAWRPFFAARRYKKKLIDWWRGNFHCELIQHPGSPLKRSYNLLHFVLLVLCLIIPKLCSGSRKAFVFRSYRR